MLIQLCFILPSDGLSFWSAVSKQLNHILTKALLRNQQLDVLKLNSFVWEKAIYSFYSIRNCIFFPHGIASVVSCAVLSMCYISHMDSHCGSCFGFLESLPLGFLVFNFHLGKITVINDVNVSSYWAVRMNSWKKRAHRSMWNSEWIGARG